MGTEIPARGGVRPGGVPELPPPPWLAHRERPQRRAGRAPLSRELIVDTALALLDREGLDSMTMRRVASNLGTGPASLYAHVANLRELEDLVFDRVAGEVPLPEPDPERWQEQLAELLFRTVVVMRGHPGVASFALGRVPTGANSLAVSDRVLGLLHAGRVPDQYAAWAVDMLGLFVAAAAYEEAVQRQQGQSEENMKDWFDQFGAYLASLPASRYPNTVRLAPLMVQGSGDERLRFGLRLLVTGLAATVASRG
jgi:AcrR family transcriptional regulator